MTPDFSLAYTTCRPHLIKHVTDLWNSRGLRQSHEFIIAVDNVPELVAAAMTAAQGVPNAKVVIQDSQPYDCVKGWNLAAANATGKVIIAVADDFVPPMNWDQGLLDLEPKGWQDGEWVVHTEDGYVHDIFVLGIITRKRYEKFGYFFYPGYESMFSDTELTVTAQRDGVVIEARHLLFEHMHPDAGKRQRDSADVRHASSDRWNRGEMLFKWRQARGFKVDMGPKAAPEVAAPPAPVNQPSASGYSGLAPVQSGRKWAAYIQVTKDEFFLFDICQRLFEEGVKDFFFCIPDEYWAGNPTPEADIKELMNIAAQLGNIGARAWTKIFDVSVYRYPGDTRLRTETRVRNDSLCWIRSQGFRDILIVDSDELWMRGTLQVIEEAVARGAVAISSPMIPVIGTPGYPVERATDVAIVYIGGNAVFQECRSPMIKPVQLQIPYVIHFTATRRTLEETIIKLRSSGHYDDPQYAFELFIEKVLPNIKPGFTYTWPTGHTGLHFYLPYQIWPSVRNWRAEERNQIPKALWPHLGQMPE